MLDETNIGSCQIFAETTCEYYVIVYYSYMRSQLAHVCIVSRNTSFLTLLLSISVLHMSVIFLCAYFRLTCVKYFFCLCKFKIQQVRNIRSKESF